MPAQDDLGAALAVFPGQSGKHFFLQQRLVPMAQGIPRLGDHALRGQELLQLLLLEIGMNLRLEDGGAALAFF